MNILAAGVDFSLKQRLTTLAVSGESWTYRNYIIDLMNEFRQRNPMIPELWKVCQPFFRIAITDSARHFGALPQPDEGHVGGVPGAVRPRKGLAGRSFQTWFSRRITWFSDIMNHRYMTLTNGLHMF